MRRWMVPLGCVGVLVGMGFVCPAIALVRDQGSLPLVEIALLLLGTALTLGGLGVIVVGIRRLCA